MHGRGVVLGVHRQPRLKLGLLARVLGLLLLGGDGDAGLKLGEVRLVVLLRVRHLKLQLLRLHGRVLLALLRLELHLLRVNL